MSTGEQAHLGPPIGLELRVASPEGIRDTCTPWHCAGAARHIVPTQHLRYWAGVSFGRASGGAPHTVPAQYLRSGQVCPSGRCRAGQQPCGHPSRVLRGACPVFSTGSCPAEAGSPFPHLMPRGPARQAAPTGQPARSGPARCSSGRHHIPRNGCARGAPRRSRDGLGGSPCRAVGWPATTPPGRGACRDAAAGVPRGRDTSLGDRLVCQRSPHRG